MSLKTNPFDYGHWVTWYFLALLGALVVTWLGRLWLTRVPRVILFHPSWANKAVAIGRFISYRHLSGSIANKLALPALGHLLLALTTVILLLWAIFWDRPYYEAKIEHGGPALGIRTGMMAGALTPFVFITCAKFNLISFVTGIGHERLNRIHRFISYISLVLAVAHAVPFLLAPYLEGGMDMLHQKFSSPGSFEYTGIIPLGLLFLLVILALPCITALAYELFVYSHNGAALAYLGVMFWHTGKKQDSWSYLWAALGLYLFSQIGRIFVKSTLRQAPPAVAELLSDDMIRLSVFVPRKYTWAPGQHCFVRIAAVSNFESHPFTIASTPLTSSTTRSFNTLTFLIRRHSGFTKRFHACLTQNTWSGNVHLEGPYGGMGWKPENRYGTIILVAGGNGITTCLSWLLYLSKRIRDDPVTLRHIYVIWLVRHRSQLMWAEREFQEARTIAPREALTFDLYITGAASQASSVHDADNIELTEINELRERERELRLEAGDNTSIRHCERGRPNIGNAIEKAPRAACTFVIGCGPESLKIDLSNAVASMQKRVLRNECAEIGLHTETYDW